MIRNSGLKNPSGCIEVTKFAAYINSFDDGAPFNIYSAFAKSCPGINTLYMKIRGCVAACYVIVDEWLQQMGQEGRKNSRKPITV